MNIQLLIAILVNLVFPLMNYYLAKVHTLKYILAFLLKYKDSERICGLFFHIRLIFHL